MADLTIFVVLLGDLPASEYVFPVKAPASISVGEWKKLVYAETRNDLITYDARNLTVWKLKDPIPTDKVDTSVAALGQDLSVVAVKMLPLKKMSAYFETNPPEECLHVIVERPSSGLKRKASADTDNGVAKKARHQKKTTQQLMDKWLQPIPVLNLQDLHIYLQQPLAEDEKIPIPQDEFDRLSTNPSVAVSPELALIAEQLETLYRVSTDERAHDIQRLFSYAIEQVPLPNGTEEAFHAMWDENISNILKLILSYAQSIRNSNRNTSTALKRPDYGLLIKNHCILRGEEKGSNTAGNPAEELVDKLIWTYDPLPYILGYHAITTDVHFIAITRPPSTAKPLFDHDLRFKKERVANLVHLIRLSGVVAQLGEQLHRRNTAEFVTFEREGGLVRMNIGAVVRKEFRHPDAIARVSKLIEIYNLLKFKQVPNVDTLDHADTREHYPYVVLSPVGYDVLPSSGLEAFNAVVCVLEALKVMHSSPDPVYHRDIRGPNIIKRTDGQGWFLIDWSDASMAPTLAADHLKPAEHSPRVRQDNHGAEVDIWGIGKYLEELASRVTCRIAKPEEVKEMARRWTTDLSTNAGAALEEITANEHLFTGPAAQIS